ncbi:hypothetical protein [Spongorhabdus nitratireducens]
MEIRPNTQGVTGVGGVDQTQGVQPTEQFTGLRQKTGGFARSLSKVAGFNLPGLSDQLSKVFKGASVATASATNSIAATASQVANSRHVAQVEGGLHRFGDHIGQAGNLIGSAVSKAFSQAHGDVANTGSILQAGMQKAGQKTFASLMVSGNEIHKGLAGVFASAVKNGKASQAEAGAVGQQLQQGFKNAGVGIQKGFEAAGSILKQWGSQRAKTLQSSANVMNQTAREAAGISQTMSKELIATQSVFKKGRHNVLKAFKQLTRDTHQQLTHSRSEFQQQLKQVDQQIAVLKQQLPPEKARVFDDKVAHSISVLKGEFATIDRNLAAQRKPVKKPVIHHRPSRPVRHKNETRTKEPGEPAVQKQKNDGLIKQSFSILKQQITDDAKNIAAASEQVAAANQEALAQIGKLVVSTNPVLATLFNVGIGKEIRGIAQGAGQQVAQTTTAFGNELLQRFDETSQNIATGVAAFGNAVNHWGEQTHQGLSAAGNEFARWGEGINQGWNQAEGEFNRWGDAINDSWSATRNEFQQWGGAINNGIVAAGNEFAEWGAAINDAQATVGNEFLSWGGKVNDGLLAAGNEFANWGDGINQGWGAVNNEFNTWGQGISTGFSSIGRSFNDFGKMTGDAFSQAGNAIGQGFNDAGQKTGEVFQSIGSKVSAWGNDVASIGAATISIAKPVEKVFHDIGNGVKNGFKSFGNNVADTGNKVVREVSKPVNKAKKFVKSLF